MTVLPSLLADIELEEFEKPKLKAQTSVVASPLRKRTLSVQSEEEEKEEEVIPYFT